MVFPGTKIEELFWKVNNGVLMLGGLIEEIIDFPINILTRLKDKKVKANFVLKILYWKLSRTNTFDSVNARDKNHRSGILNLGIFEIFGWIFCCCCGGLPYALYNV